MKETIMMPIKAVKPYPGNPRQNADAVDKVAASLREFGFRQPIVVDKDNVIIVGHTRLQAAKKLKMKEVPVLVADDMSEDQVRAYRLADNKTAEFSLWDNDRLADELDAITEIDMEQFGFDLTADEESEEEGDAVDEDNVSEDAETRCKLGDIWILGDHRLICGDSTDVGVIGRLLGDTRPALLLTDPPYGINVVQNDTHIGNPNFGLAVHNSYEKIVGDDTTDTAQAAYDLASQLTDKQIIFGGNYFLEFLPPSDGWLIWDKRGDSGIRNSFADGEMAWCSFHTPVRIYHQLWNGMIREGEHEKRVHPTQKPVQMLSDIITDFTDEADTVLDLFGGSGSTLIACEKTGRICFMCELSEHYCDVIINRWEQATGLQAELLQTDSEED